MKNTAVARLRISTLFAMPGVALIFINFIDWYLLSHYLFAVLLAKLLLWLCFLVSSAWSLVYFIRKIANDKLSWVPLMVNTALLVVLFSIPFGNIMRTVDFKSNLQSRKKVISLVRSGRLDSREGIVVLPSQYKHLSVSAKIYVERPRGSSINIWFITYKGFMAGNSGFLYISNDQPPSVNFQGIYDGTFEEFEKLRPNWYWVSDY